MIDFLNYTKHKKVIGSIMIIGILLVVHNSIVCSIYGQVSDLSSSFEEHNDTIDSFLECYSTNVANFLLANMFMPFTIDLTDPKMKKLITSLCNFYHEKMGKWVDLNKDSEIMKPYNQEFWSQYPINELPKELIEFWKDNQYTIK